jgi:hypothetical protein
VIHTAEQRIKIPHLDLFMRVCNNPIPLRGVDPQDVAAFRKVERADRFAGRQVDPAQLSIEDHIVALIRGKEYAVQILFSRKR